VRASAALVAALCLVLAGCTGEGDRAAGPKAVATAPAQADNAPADGAPSPTPTPSSSFANEDSVLTVAIPEPETLDPMLLGDPGSVLVARQLYEGLTAWDPQRQEVVPAAARSWEVKKGGRRFVFHLRRDLTFHDGTPVAASDFKYAFDRIAQRRNASGLAYTLERVAGFDRVNQLGETDRLRGVKAPRDGTLVIELAKPFHEFPAVLTHPALVPLPRKSARDLDEFLQKPIGNGPFRLARPWTAGEPVMLEAYDDFYSSPQLDGIEFMPFSDAAESWLLFEQGDIHVAEVPVGQAQPAAEAYGTRGYKQFLTGYYYAFNLDAGSFRNPRLRKAVSRAVDKQRIADRIYKGSMEPIDGIVPPGMPGFERNLCDDPCSPQRGPARRIVRGLPRKARSISLEFTRGRTHDQIASSITRDLRRIGLRVTTRSYGFARYLKRLSSGHQGFYRLGWIAEYPSPDVFLGSLLRSSSPDNYSGFGSARIDRLLAKAYRQPHEQARTRLYRRAERAAMEAHVIVPVGAFVHRWAARPEVEGIEFDVMGGFDAAGVSLEQGD
jgi:oligopeptide transport system substrate-binding protein